MSNIKLTPEDKHYIKLTEDGVRPSTAFRQAYPNHPTTIKWLQSEPGSPDRQKAANQLKQYAFQKLNTKYMTKARETYQDSMEKFSELSVETAIDLVKNARSEKVRADLAIEGMRQKVGTPVQKVSVEEEKTIVITFGKPPEDKPTFIEGEAVGGDPVGDDDLA